MFCDVPSFVHLCIICFNSQLLSCNLGCLHLIKADIYVLLLCFYFPFLLVLGFKRTDVNSNMEMGIFVIAGMSMGWCLLQWMVCGCEWFGLAKYACIRAETIRNVFCLKKYVKFVFPPSDINTNTNNHHVFFCVFVPCCCCCCCFGWLMPPCILHGTVPTYTNLFPLHRHFPYIMPLQCSRR